MIAPSVDAILALDPELKILQQFSENGIQGPTLEEQIAQLQTLVAKKETIELSERLLQMIAPNEERYLLPIPKSLKDKITVLVMSRIRSLVLGDNRLSPIEQRTILKDESKYFQYISQQAEVECVACMALMADFAPDAIRKSADHLVRWFHFGYGYRQLGYLREADYEALFRLDSFLGKNINILLQASMLGAKERHLVQTQLYARLGKVQEYFWEWEAAMQSYRKRTILEYQTGETIDFEGSLTVFIDCLKKHFQYPSALDLTTHFLNGQFQVFGITQKVELAATTRAALEMTLLQLLERVNPPPTQYQVYLSAVKSESIQTFQQMLEQMQTKDEINIESMEKLLAAYEKMNQQAAAVFSHEWTEKDQFQQVLRQLTVMDGGNLITYTNKLKELAPLLEQQSKDWQLLYQLHQAKLKYFQRDATAIADYEELLPQMKSHVLFDKSRQFNWLVESIRVASLAIVERPDQLYMAIKEKSIVALNLQLRNELKITVHFDL